MRIVSRPPGAQGFTLLELIVVMALIALTAAFAVPQFGGFFAGDRMKTSVRKLVGLVQQTAGLARRYQEPYLLQYRENERRFVVVPERERTEQEKRAGEQETLSLAVGDAVTVGEFWSWYGGSLAGNERVIRFSREGYIEPTILYFGRVDGPEMSIILPPFLGKIRVEDRHVIPEAGLFAQ